jgi:predicted nucleotidyltransferase
MTDRIDIPHEEIAEYARRRHIRRLSLYGSVLRADFDQNSDIDILVEFEPEHVPGLLGIARMERELSTLLDGRKVDLRTPEDLSRYFRQRVLQEAKPLYVRG